MFYLKQVPIHAETSIGYVRHSLVMLTSVANKSNDSQYPTHQLAYGLGVISLVRVIVAGTTLRFYPKHHGASCGSFPESSIHWHGSDL